MRKRISTASKIKAPAASQGSKRYSLRKTKERSARSTNQESNGSVAGSEAPVVSRRTTKNSERARIAGVKREADVVQTHMKKKPKTMKLKVEVESEAHVAVRDGSVTGQQFYSPAIEQELAAYNDRLKDDYHPGRYNAKQLGNAIKEFERRWGGVDEETEPSDEPESLFVWAARECSELPDKHMIASALHHAGLSSYKVSWLLYDGNLFITKLSQGHPHYLVLDKVLDRFKYYWRPYFEMEVGWVASDVDSVLEGKKKAAPDAYLQFLYPPTPRLRSPLVIEVEVHNRTPTGLMEQLAIYFQQPEVKYALGLKFYDKRPKDGTCAAFAVLWRRNGQEVPRVERVISFGSATLDRTAITAFLRGGRALNRKVTTIAVPTREQLENHTPYGSQDNVITIPNAELIDGVQYPNPDPNSANELIDVPRQDRDFELDLNEVFKCYLLALRIRR